MGTSLFTADEIADRLRLKAETVRRWARENKIPSFRPSPKVLRFDWDAVCKALRDGPLPFGQQIERLAQTMAKAGGSLEDVHRDVAELHDLADPIDFRLVDALNLSTTVYEMERKALDNV